MKVTKAHRIHIFGAAGAGTTTIGALLGQRLSLPHFDTDNYIWQQTDPPYKSKHLPQVRVQRLRQDMQRSTGWILSGSLVGWGDVFVLDFSVAVFVTLPKSLRLERLRIREETRYGTRIAAGSDLHEAHQTFMSWAAAYDDPDSGLIKSRTVHEGWIQQLSCPVIRLENTASPIDAVQRLQSLLP